MSATLTTETVADGLVVQQMAAAAYAAIRELGVCSGELDIPAWQFARGQLKRDYLLAVRLACDGRSAADVHDGWRLARLAQGWHLAGEYDEEGLGSPDMRLFKDLPAVRRLEYGVLTGIVRGFLRQD